MCTPLEAYYVERRVTVCVWKCAREQQVSIPQSIVIYNSSLNSKDFEITISIPLFRASEWQKSRLVV